MIPRPEYPRPQYRRAEWLCLNGEWQFEIDHGDSGLAQGWVTRQLSGKIMVPFCPESELSGVGYIDFMPAVWYRRTVTIPPPWNGKRVLLHFGAVDYDATVWVNGVEVGRHRGGFTPFTCDLAGMVKAGEAATIVVRARDTSREPQPRGKQSPYYNNVGCLYTRTTGIWQTVWLEPVPESHFDRPRLDWDATAGSIRLTQPVIGAKSGMKLMATVSDQQGEVSRVVRAASPGMVVFLDLPIPPERVHIWQPGDGYLYDVQIDLFGADEEVIDRVESYTGLRTLAVDGKAVLINGKPVFQRLVLDQGYYPDGILTAPTDAALVKDIESSLSAGFNGARLHQKVFEERFLYHADRLGYMVWGEFPDWGYRKDDGHEIQPPATYITQWMEVLQRDVSHPAIVGWCPLNETWEVLGDRFSMLDEVMRGMWLAAKTVDGTRPVLDTSGYSHRVRETDIYDCHDYEQDVERFRANHAETRNGEPFYNGPINTPWSIPYNGQPYFVSEFGGIWWNPEAKPGEDSWGYGERVRSLDEWYARFKGLCDVLLDDSSMFAYCYTQLTDVYQEQNGIFTFNRLAKFDIDKLHRIQSRPAAIEG